MSWLDPIADAAVFEKASELAVIIALFGTGLKLERELRLARLVGRRAPAARSPCR